MDGQSVVTGREAVAEQRDASVEGDSAVTKADLVEEIAKRTGLTKKDIGQAVDGFIEAMKNALTEGHHIEIRGFGTFSVKDRKARTARNPRTGEAVPLPPRRVPVFKVSRDLKERVLGSWD
ncbi:MAG: integration host factor subunit beta [Candidatus Eisenbacteria sp.]|nr:integration host factor subunit beta [Candidatus Eisenbacteria bacterium]